MSEKSKCKKAKEIGTSENDNVRTRDRGKMCDEGRKQSVSEEMREPEETPTTSRKDEPSKEVLMARELLSAATETFKMAQHIRKLENEIHKLKRKMKKRESSEDDSSREDSCDVTSSDSCDSDDSLYNQKRKSKRKRRARRSLKGKQEILAMERNRLTNLQARSQQSDSQSEAPLEVSGVTPGRRAPAGVARKPAAGTKEMVCRMFLCDFCGRPFTESDKDLLEAHAAQCAKTKGRAPAASPGIETKMRVISIEPSEARSGPAQNVAASAASQREHSLMNVPTTTLKPELAADDDSAMTRDDEHTAQMSLPGKTQVKAKAKPISGQHGVQKEGSFHKETRDLEMTCSDCGLRLARVAKAHHAKMCKKKPVCLYCAKTFTSIMELEQHKPDCKKANWQDHPIRLLQHEIYVPDSQLTWVKVGDNTGRTLATAKGKVEPMKKKEDEEKPQRGIIFHVCMTCDKHFSSAEQLRQHKECPQECRVFMQQKKRPGGLKQSQRFCYVCMQNFANQLLYINHKAKCDASHIAKKERGMFNCFICYKGFGTKDELKQHKQLWHINAADNSNCWVCGQMFSSFKEMLRHHDETHKEHTGGATPRRCVATANPHLVLKTGVEELTAVDSETQDMVNETIKTIDFGSLIDNVDAQIDTASTKAKKTNATGMKTTSGEAEHRGDVAITQTTTAGRQVKRESLATGAGGAEAKAEKMCEEGRVVGENVTRSVQTPQSEDMECTIIRVKKGRSGPVYQGRDSNIKERKTGGVSQPGLAGVDDSTGKEELSSNPARLQIKPNKSVSNSSKADGILGSLKDCGVESKAVRNALSQLGINSPVRIVSADPSLVVNLKNLANAKQVQLPGNKKGYVFKVSDSSSKAGLWHKQAAQSPETSRSVNVPADVSARTEPGVNPAGARTVASAPGVQSDGPGVVATDASVESSGPSNDAGSPREATSDAGFKEATGNSKERPSKAPLGRGMSRTAVSTDAAEGIGPQNKDSNEKTTSREGNGSKLSADVLRDGPSHTDANKNVGSCEDGDVSGRTGGLTSRTPDVKVSRGKGRRKTNKQQSDGANKPMPDSAINAESAQTRGEKAAAESKAGKPRESARLDESAASQTTVKSKQTSDDSFQYKVNIHSFTNDNQKLKITKSKADFENIPEVSREKLITNEMEEPAACNQSVPTTTDEVKRLSQLPPGTVTSSRSDNKVVQEEKLQEKPKAVKTVRRQRRSKARSSVEKPSSRAREKGKSGGQGGGAGDACQSAAGTSELFSSTLNGVERTEGRSVPTSPRKRRRGRTTEKVEPVQSKVLKVQPGVQKSEGQPARRTITSGGIEMLVSVTDDKIVCSRCWSVMSSIAEIAKHKCYSNSASNKPEPSAKTKEETIAGAAGDGPRVGEVSTVRSPKLRSYSKRGNDSVPAVRSRSYESEVKRRGVDLGPELVDVIDAELSDGCNVDIVGDTDDL